MGACNITLAEMIAGKFALLAAFKILDLSVVVNTWCTKILGRDRVQIRCFIPWAPSGLCAPSGYTRIYSYLIPGSYFAETKKKWRWLAAPVFT